MSDRTDPLEGQSLTMLNTMLSRLWPLAKDGEPEAIDRVIKILILKHRYDEDRQKAAKEWKI